MSTTHSLTESDLPRHTALVRVTHWITVVSFFALLITGVAIVFSHPRFYWGEVGNVNTTPLFTLHIPSSRATVPTGYSFGMPDMNGWGRYLHFQAAWAILITGLVYIIASLVNGHLRRDLLPARSQRTWRAYWNVLAKYLHRTPPDDTRSYNTVQRTAYLAVLFLLLPLIIWTGLAMSPSFTSAFPLVASALGGRQSARTLHFFLSGALVLFFVVHVTMVALSGFRDRMRAMIVGRAVATDDAAKERP